MDLGATRNDDGTFSFTTTVPLHGSDAHLDANGKGPAGEEETTGKTYGFIDYLSGLLGASLGSDMGDAFVTSVATALDAWCIDCAQDADDITYTVIARGGYEALETALSDVVAELPMDEGKLQSLRNSVINLTQSWLATSPEARKAVQDRAQRIIDDFNAPKLAAR